MGMATFDAACRLQLADLSSLREQTDEALFEASQAGNDLAFRTLVERHARLVRRLVLNVLRDEHEAEDVTQEVFVSAWKSLDTWKPEAKFTTWLHRVAVNKAVDRYRRRRTILEPQEVITQLSDRLESMVDTNDQQDELEYKESSATLRKALDLLPENQRQALNMFYFEDCDVAQIASAMSCSEQAVRSLLKRGRQALRTRLRSKKKICGYGSVSVQGSAGSARR